MVSLGYNASDELVEFLKSCFALLQYPFDAFVRKAGWRYSMINLNFLFRRFFELWGAPHLGVDFPPLKSKKKREDTIVAYLQLTRYTKWPYINYDAKLFGAEYHTEWSTSKNRLGRGYRPSRKRHAAAGAGDRPTPHAEGGAGGLRGECEGGESGQNLETLLDEDLYSIFSALLGIADSGHSGARNDGS